MTAELWAVVGATGSGKTDCAVRLAEDVGGEIVSVDSAQIYRGLDIGSAKPTPEERLRAPHHLIDVLEPHEQWTAAGFAAAADRAIAEVLKRGRKPILCGGAGLWYRALTRGVFEAPQIDASIRAEIRQTLRDRGSAFVHEALKEIDPVAAERLHPNDAQRIGRALEVFRQTGRPISALQDEHRFGTARYQVRGIALKWSRQALWDRLQFRVQRMFDAGLVAEVEALRAQGVPDDSPGLRSIGYAQVVRHLRGELDDAETRELIFIATRQYAKHQVGWFRSEPGITWIEPEAPAEDVQALFDQAE